MRQATFIKPAEVERTWYIIDGTGKTLGRSATEVTSVLRGKYEPTYTPNTDCSDFVIVTNTDKVEPTGNKLDTKKYYNHSGYTGGLRTRTARVMKDNYTVEQIERAIHDMLPHIELGDKMRGHLFVYEGSEHSHAVQKPVELKIKGQEE